MVILDISDITVPKLLGHLEVYPPLGSPIACHTVLPLPKRKLAIMSSEGIGADVCAHVFGVKKPVPLNFAGIVDVSDETNPSRLRALLIKISMKRMGGLGRTTGMSRTTTHILKTGMTGHISLTLMRE
jgi:hypothetical protein